VAAAAAPGAHRPQRCLLLPLLPQLPLPLPPEHVRQQHRCQLLVPLLLLPLQGPLLQAPLLLLLLRCRPGSSCLTHGP
jgi:hypothetical protein